MRKIQTITINIFYFYFLYGKYYFFIQKTYLKKLISYIVKFVLQFFRVAGYWNCSNKTPTPISIYIFLADAVPRPEKTGNRLGILTQFLIAVDYHFFFIYISEKYLQFRKIQKHLFSKIFGSPHTRNRIYFLLNCFQTVDISKICA